MAAIPGALAAPGAPVAALDPQDISLGQSLMLRVSIPGEVTAAITVPDMADWTVVPRGRVHGLGGPDGQAGQEVTAYRFELVPRRSGTLAVPGLDVEMGGQTYRTAPLTALVRPRPTPPRTLAGQDIFLEAVLSRPAPYSGESFVYTLRLYRAVPAESIRLVPPRLAAMEVTPLPGQRDGEIVAAGRRYAVTEADYLLVGTTPGRTLIPPAEVVCRGVPGKGGAALDLTAKSPAVTVSVRPLPMYVPVSGEIPFTGLVGGRMTLVSRLDGGDAGRGAVYTLTLAGRGNLRDAAPPPVVAPEGLALRLLDVTGGGDSGRSGYVGQRVFRYAVRADKPGDYTLGPVRLAVFDPTAGRYVVVEAPARNYIVPAASPVPADPALAPPLRHRPGSRLHALPSWPWRLTLALLPPLAFVLTVLPVRRDPGKREGRTFDGPPTALAEALRERLERRLGHAEAREGPAVDAAVLALRNLDAILYSGRPVTDRERETVSLAAVRAFEELGT